MINASILLPALDPKQPLYQLFRRRQGARGREREGRAEELRRVLYRRDQVRREQAADFLSEVSSIRRSIEALETGERMVADLIPLEEISQGGE